MEDLMEENSGDLNIFLFLAQCIFGMPLSVSCNWCELLSLAGLTGLEIVMFSED